MSPRTPTLPLTEPAMWRKLLARTHPDAGGSHDLFIWADALRETVCGGEIPLDPRRHKQHRPPPTDNTRAERIPYPDGDPDAFEAATDEALRIAEAGDTGNAYGGLLSLLADCKHSEAYAYREERGASYRQLAAIGHTVGMSGAERSGWYAVAKEVPLSDRHAGHILGRLKSAAA